MAQASEMAGHKMVVALCCFGILMTVIYKQCPRNLIKSTGQWDALKHKRSCCAEECRLWDEARPLSG